MISDQINTLIYSNKRIYHHRKEGTPIGTCVRRECNNEAVTGDPHRLCKRCKRKRNKNKRKQSDHDNTPCAYKRCEKTLAGTRNTTFCSKQCRQLSSRKLIDLPAAVGEHSYIQNVVNAISRSPLGPSSLNSVDDITDYCQLFVRKARYQYSYTEPMTSPGMTLKPIPLLFLEVCHLYPLDACGANSALNLFIGPKSFNRENNTTIPYQGHGFGGLQRDAEPMLFEGSCMDALISRFGQEALSEALKKVPLRRFHGNYQRPLIFRGIHEIRPYFTLFRDELARLKGEATAAFLFRIEQIFNLYPVYLELLALVGFKAVLLGDPDNLLVRMRRIFNKCFGYTTKGRPRSPEDFHERYQTLMYRFIGKYLKRDFKMDITNKCDVIRFYNSFFSRPVVGIGWGDTIACRIYDGEFYSQETTYFSVHAYTRDPVKERSCMFDDIGFD